MTTDSTPGPAEQPGPAVPPGTPPRSGARSEDARVRILEMLEDGKITASEAAELLNALSAPAASAGPDRPARRERRAWFEAAGPGAGGVTLGKAHFLRVRVTDTRSGREHANVAVPLGVLNVGLGFAHRFRVPGRAGSEIDSIVDAVRAGRRGTLYDVQSPDRGERVEIILD